MRTTAAALILSAAAAIQASGSVFQDVCGEEAARLCPTQTDGGLLACLLRQQASVSNRCWGVIATLEPCAGDIERRCFSATPGGGRVLRCLESQRRDLAAACAQALDIAEQAMRSHGQGPPPR